MLRSLVVLALDLAAAYGICGTVFALAFHARGLHQVDPASRGAGLGFRLLITPGLIALWPLMAFRWPGKRHAPDWLGATEAPVPPERLRTLHRLAWKALAVLIPLLIAVALLGRPDPKPPIQSTLPTTTP